MTDEVKSGTRKYAESGLFWWRIILTVGGILWFTWTQFVGDGIRNQARDFLGINEMRDENTQQFRSLNDRMSFIESSVAPAPVVTWIVEASGQVGTCTADTCIYRVVGSRTEFGDNCGPVTATERRIRSVDSGRQTTIGTKPGYVPTNFNRTPVDLLIPLDIPSSLPPGEYVWQTEMTYDRCPGPNEPITRYSPWWPLTIGEQP